MKDRGRGHLHKFSRLRSCYLIRASEMHFRPRPLFRIFSVPTNDDMFCIFTAYHKLTIHRVSGQEIQTHNFYHQFPLITTRPGLQLSKNGYCLWKGKIKFADMALYLLKKKTNVNCCWDVQLNCYICHLILSIEKKKNII